MIRNRNILFFFFRNIILIEVRIMCQIKDYQSGENEKEKYSYK